MASKRAVCLNCIDGRAQLPVIHFIKEKYGFDHVDMVTEPGMDALLSDPNNSIDSITQKVSLSIEKNKSEIIFVTGHYDCQGNPVNESKHKEHINTAVDRIKKLYSNKEVIGLWLNDQWNAEIQTN